jgi:hypothetical protein
MSKHLNHWHVVRLINSLVNLSPITKSYSIRLVGPGIMPLSVVRVAWRKDRLKVKISKYPVLWRVLRENDRIEDSLGRVFVRGSELNKGVNSNDNPSTQSQADHLNA